MTDRTTPQVGANGGAMPALADDMLKGAKAISRFVFGDDSDGNVRRIYHAASKLGLPTFQMGATICARKSSILKWIERQEQAA